jgi:hypothetical protein
LEPPKATGSRLPWSRPWPARRAGQLSSERRFFCVPAVSQPQLVIPEAVVNVIPEAVEVEPQDNFLVDLTTPRLPRSVLTSNSRPGLGATSPAQLPLPKQGTPPRVAAGSLNRPATSPHAGIANGTQPAASLRNHSVARAAQSTPKAFLIIPWCGNCR